MAPSNEDKIGSESVELLRGWGRVGSVVGCDPRLTDPVGMEYVFEVADAPTRTQLVALRLSTTAQVLRIIADEAEKASHIISKKEP
jgi:hypothetical protein